MMEKSQLEFNYLLQPDDVRAVNESMPQSSVNGNVFRGTGRTSDVISQRAWRYDTCYKVHAAPELLEARCWLIIIGLQ